MKKGYTVKKVDFKLVVTGYRWTARKKEMMWGSEDNCEGKGGREFC